MSGHSKWAQIKRQKGANDAKRGQLFTKLGREITVAAREGGGDPDANFRLRLAMQKARDSNMPMENIERAVKRATGGLDGVTLEDIVYEGYGPNGVAIMVEALTDNRNRTVSEVRNAFTRGGGSLGESGCVNWLFDSKGVITVESGKMDPDEVALMAIDAGAEDVRTEDGTVDIYTAPNDLEATRQAIEKTGLRVTSAELTMQAKSTVELDEKDAIQVLKMMERLEDLDDVQRVHSNLDISEELMEKYAG